MVKPPITETPRENSSRGKRNCLRTCERGSVAQKRDRSPVHWRCPGTALARITILLMSRSVTGLRAGMGEWCHGEFSDKRKKADCTVRRGKKVWRSGERGRDGAMALGRRGMRCSRARAHDMDVLCVQQPSRPFSIQTVPDRDGNIHHGLVHVSGVQGSPFSRACRRPL